MYFTKEQYQNRETSECKFIKRSFNCYLNQRESIRFLVIGFWLKSGQLVSRVGFIVMCLSEEVLKFTLNACYICSCRFDSGNYSIEDLFHNLLQHLTLSLVRSTSNYTSYWRIGTVIFQKKRSTRKRNMTREVIVLVFRLTQQILS